MAHPGYRRRNNQYLPTPNSSSGTPPQQSKKPSEGKAVARLNLALGTVMMIIQPHHIFDFCGVVIVIGNTIICCFFERRIVYILYDDTPIGTSSWMECSIGIYIIRLVFFMGIP